MPSEDYIATKDLNEVGRIHSNSQYANWRFEYVDGEYRFYSPNYKKTNENTYVTLEQLEPLLSESGYMCYGHGTGRKGNADEVVNSIFNEGLRTKNNSLYYTTIGLSTPTPELKEQCKEIGIPEPTIENLKKQFNNWPHQNSKKIIIARVPTKYINKAGDRSDLDGEMFGAFYTQKLQPNGHATNYLDSKFIIGCYDVEKQAVRLNKNFERTLTPETIEKLKENYQKVVEKTNARKKRQAMGITQEEINLAQQQEQIQQLKVQIANYDIQIERLLASMQPYMQIPKVNQEISKVIEKNNEINSSQIINSLNDYKNVVEIKQSLLSYLEKADKFIKDNVGITQKSAINQQPAQSQTVTQSLPDNFWDEFDQPQEKQITTNQSFEEIMDEFKNPNLTTGPERRYNSDGTYTMEYIAHLANTPLGFNKNIYDQLMQENEFKRQQSNEQMPSGGRHM